MRCAGAELARYDGRTGNSGAYELSAQYVIDHWNAVFPTGDCTTKFGYSLLEHAEEKR